MKLLLSLLAGVAMATGVDAPPPLSAQTSANVAAVAPALVTAQASPRISGQSAGVTAVPPVPAPFDQQAALKQASKALSAVRSATGAFTLIAPDGGVSQGTFWLQRPGRMRFEYAPPAQLLIVADGTTVAIEDRELETFDRGPISATPLGLILKSNVDLARDAKVERVSQADGMTLISVTDPTGEADGVLTLVFAPKTYDLIEWRVTDATGAATLVMLDNVKTGGRFDPRLFILDEEDDPTARRGR
jgi:outer membrane lipoprotein-sorting protein